ncbi:helix-turn-helix domain-containing protein [Maridesulfovibrio sp.]|uniref:helix-turn-helix domain-containing protein n=1 Tax=Maridesulfovibrio sp. TaxID=2795000 RepID=UPI0039F107A4
MKSIHTDEYKNFITILIDARKRVEKTQMDVANILDKPQSYIAKYEGCERRIDVLEFIKICQAIDVDPISVLREADLLP